MINPCSSSPCQNDGLCFNDENYESFTCSCTEGFVGDLCVKEIPCFNNPCLNGANCLNSDDMLSFTCNCENTTFSGELCENLLPCANDPCQNDAQCTVGKIGKKHGH